MTVKLKKNKSKSDKSKSAWHSRKYVTTELNFFHIQFEVPTVILQKYSLEGPQFLHLLWVFCQDLELQAALTGRKKPVFGAKKGCQ